MNLTSSHIDMIDKSSVFEKTLAGRAEILDRSQKLSLPERQVLILADGLRDVGQMQQMLGAPLAPLLDKLQDLGLLQVALPASDDVDGVSGFDFLAEEPGSPGKARASFDGASAHLFRAKVVPTDAEVTAAVGSQEVGVPLTARGIFYGKNVLLETLDHMLPRQAMVLNRKIAGVNSEAALYYVFEQAIQVISKNVSVELVDEITRRFDEEVSRP